MTQRFFVRVCVGACAVFVFVGGCAPQSAEDCASRSHAYYLKAVRGYKERISRGQQVDSATVKLGRLYYDHGAFDDARTTFASSGSPESAKYLALTYHAMGRFRDALALFDAHDFHDDEYRYYHGRTAEQLNLYDLALKQYRSIASKPWLERAQARLEAIERGASEGMIADIDPVVARIVAGAPSTEKYPQAGALILSCDERIDITREGEEVSELHYVIKILNDRGKDDFSETLISYDSTFETVELLYARTIKPDGTVVNVGSRHIRDVSKYLNFPLYSNVRVFIISFPEITDGAVIDYTVKVHNNELINKKDFVLSYPVQSSEPVLDARFTVTMPADRPVHFKTLNGAYNTFGAIVQPAVSQVAGTKIFRWVFKDIPQIVSEPRMPAQVEINPTILVSSFASWDDIYAWWWALARDKMVADDAIRQQVAALTTGAATDQDKARVLYEFCAQEIRYVAVEYGQAGYEPHYAGDILKNKYGDCKDQAILLVTMLKEAGIPAWPVLIATREYYDLDPAFPSMLFNHCIAAASVGGQTVFMDPTAQTCSFEDLPAADQSRKVLVCTPENYRIETTPLFPSAHNAARQRLRLTLKADESVEGEKTVETFGIYDQAQRYWLLYTQPELIEQALKEKVQDISVGGSLRSYQIENLRDLRSPVVLRYAFGGPEYLTAAGNLRLVPRLAYFDASVVAQDERLYPIDFATLDTRDLEFEIKLGSQTSVRYLPSSVQEDNLWFRFNVDYEHRKDSIRCAQTFVLKRRTVEVKEYAEFKRVCERLAQAVKQSIVLEKR